MMVDFTALIAIFLFIILADPEMGHIINITWAAELNSLIEKHAFIAFYKVCPF